MYERVCVTCREAFTPLEGNDTRDFCSDQHEIDYYESDNMSNYIFVREDKWVGPVKIYLHKNTGKAIVISRADTFDRGDETMIFAYDLQANKVADWTDLYAGYGRTHEQALAEFEADWQ